MHGNYLHSYSSLLSSLDGVFICVSELRHYALICITWAFRLHKPVVVRWLAVNDVVHALSVVPFAIAVLLAFTPSNAFQHGKQTLDSRVTVHVQKNPPYLLEAFCYGASVVSFRTKFHDSILIHTHAKVK